MTLPRNAPADSFFFFFSVDIPTRFAYLVVCSISAGFLIGWRH